MTRHRSQTTIQSVLPEEIGLTLSTNWNTKHGWCFLLSNHLIVAKNFAPSQLCWCLACPKVPASALDSDPALHATVHQCPQRAHSWRSTKITGGDFRIFQDSARFCKILQDSARFCKILQAHEDLSHRQLLGSHLHHLCLALHWGSLSNRHKMTGLLLKEPTTVTVLSTQDA